MADVLGILGGAAEALQGISLPQVNQGNIYVEESLTPGPGACFPLDLPAFTGVLFRRFLPMLCRLVLASSSSSFHVFPFLSCAATLLAVHFLYALAAPVASLFLVMASSD